MALLLKESLDGLKNAMELHLDEICFPYTFNFPCDWGTKAEEPITVLQTKTAVASDHFILDSFLIP